MSKSLGNVIDPNELIDSLVKKNIKNNIEKRHIVEAIKLYILVKGP